MFNARNNLCAATNKTITLSEWDGPAAADAQRKADYAWQKAGIAEAGALGESGILASICSVPESNQQHTEARSTQSRY